jgi:hypothetical protein
MTKKKKNTVELAGYRIYSQYILAGLGIGLYYGIFSHTTQTEPDYGMAVILSVLAGALTTVIRNWKKKKTFRAYILDFLKTAGMFLAFLLALQLKPVIEGFGGRILMIVFMTVVGLAFGVVLGGVRRKTPQPSTR